MTIELIEGWSEAVDYKLLADSVAVDLTGYSGGQATSTALSTVFPELHTRNVRSTSTGLLSIVSATCGIVRFTPGSCTDLAPSPSPYSFRVGMRSAGGKLVYFPNGEPEQWIVRSLG